MMGWLWSSHFCYLPVSFIQYYKNNPKVPALTYKFRLSHMHALRKLTYNIIQNTKRLRTFSIPQESLIIPIDPAIFQEASLRVFIRFKDAFEKMALNNQQKQIEVKLKGLDYLQVVYGAGSFVLQAEADTSTLFFTSPVGGTFKYYYDVEQERFYSNKDGHLLDENLTRQAQKCMGDILLL